MKIITDVFIEEDMKGPLKLHSTLPVSEKFYYPVEKAHNESNVDAMRLAEANLDAFCQNIDSHFLKHGKQTLFQVFDRIAIHPRQLHRTPQWTPIVRRAPPPREPTACTGTWAPELVSEKAGRFHPEPLRMKIKTRGSRGPSELETCDTVKSVQTTDAEADRQQPIFSVKKREWKVFLTMFHDKSGNTQAGEIAWSDFLHAMTKISFQAEKLYGSVWQFTPARVVARCVDKSIHFREPHQSGKIPFRTARRWGRRLSRSYGFSAESFDLA